MKFGLLSYTNTNNLGDEMQSLAAQRFLPRVDYRIDRDALGDFRSDGGEPVALILNGWFGHRPETWPPSEAIVPLLTSLHLSPYPGTGIARIAAEKFFLQEPAAGYLRRAAPVGARDLHTLALLEKHQIPAYLSGCLTLTLERDPKVATVEDVILNDVPDEVFAWARKRTARRLLHTKHADTVAADPETRFGEARALLALYQSAHCVVTTRLHCALPCLALGTPVLLLDVGQEPSRFTGLDRLFRHCTVEDLLAGRARFDLDRPEPNGTDHEKLRSNLTETVSAFVARSAAGGAARNGSEISPSLRFETLLHLHGDLVARLEREQRAAGGERHRLEHELELRGREIVELRTALARATDDKNRLQTDLDTVLTSTEWRAATGLKEAVHRFPRLTAPVRGLVGKLFKP